MLDLPILALAAAAGLVGGAMNALAGGGTFATMPALIAIGLPSPIANATSNVALQPGAFMSAYTYREGLRPVAGMSVRTLAGITFVGGLVGSLLLVVTPTTTFDIIIPWLLLMATIAIAFGKRAAEVLQRHAAPGPRALFVAQALLGVYGGYFGGGVGMMLTAVWGLLAGEPPHRLMAPRTLMLAVANTAAMIVFIGFGMVRWDACLPMLAGAVLGGWLGARAGKKLPPTAIRIWTLLVTIVTTIVFFVRAYG
ncbi:sulfite exporter TauE/SafE family protein [Sphingomonas qomolangmaensis]|uniref:Probable membrane transporter protein n=1 Tax=Sphingomonas qomolangmaensis TaxID=2918765 RepID=A0ABY5L9N2_9SPHN|nr:sulfite exporter TauE/SafE family protein [Sphingomonas qomolangmaensis]UUL82293.1 sulfite exporter TauE/SafE family protein [Sphingomonas qomolangmaensis]